MTTGRYSRLMRFFSPALILTALLTPSLFAQQEIGLTIGAMTGPVHVATSGQSINLSTGTALQANYARFLKAYKLADLYGEAHLLVSPYQSNDSTLTSVTKNFTSIYMTPGVRLKFYPKKALSPWVVGGGGYALYIHSSKTIAGGVSLAPSKSTLAMEIGGGLDYKWTDRFTLRMETRSFYTGNARYNTPVNGSVQFNFTVGGGIVFNLK